MSGANTKAQKIDRIRQSQIKAEKVGDDRYYNIEKVFLDIIEKQEAAIAQLTATNNVLANTASGALAEVEKLRKYLGGELFKRRQADAANLFNQTFPFLAIPTLEPNWGNHVNELPHNTKGTV